MKSSPVFPKDESRDSISPGYDPLDDFSQFLEEARKHANQVILNSSQPSSYSKEEATVVESRMSKKSLKETLLFWQKLKKSNASATIATNGSRVCNPKNSAVSGPLSATASKDRGRTANRISRPMSGRLFSWFTPRRAAETEIPYVCLDQQNHSHRVRHYGPIYKVT